MLKLQVIGHLGNDCTTKDIGGKKVINFSVAHTEKRKNNAGSVTEYTTWISCSWWLDNTSIAQYLKKGKQVYVEGSPSSSAFSDNQGKLRSSQNLNVRNLILLGGGSSSEREDTRETGGDQHEEPGMSGPPPAGDPIDDLPF